MEEYLLYTLIGAIIGLLIISFLQDVERQKTQSIGFLKSKVLELNNKRPSHPDAIKEAAIEKCYQFAASKTQFSLKDIEQQTQTLHQYYNDVIESKVVYKRNFSEKNSLRFNPLQTLDILIIINEGLHNAAIHSNAAFIFNIASVEKDILSIITHDNGTGYDRKNTLDNTGIQLIKDAVNSLNATLKLTSTTGNGTVVNVAIDTRQL